MNIRLIWPVLLVYFTVFVFSVNTNDTISSSRVELSPISDKISIPDKIFLEKIFDKYGDSETMNFEVIFL